MAKDAAKYVKEEEDGWLFQCPVTDGTCGADGVGFRSSQWPRKSDAVARGNEHIAEHKGEGVTSSLDEFRAARGLQKDPEAGVVTVKDL